LITGATSGIGEAAARALAEDGYNVIITGRRAQRLKRLKLELEQEFGVDVLPLCFDIRERAQCESVIDSLPQKFANISILINNAGLAAGFEHFYEGNTKDWDAMIDTNVKGLMYITRKVCQKIIENGASGHIVNIGSIAGTQPYENGNVYCASKHAVHALSQAMRIDLLTKQIRVTEIRPGMVDTEFSSVRFHGDEHRAKEVYEGIRPLSGEDIAETILWVISQPSHVNIDEVVITPTQQANAYYIIRKSKQD
jgi:NADP-dependent 3-hydroxy acid dehydrogenase YdfG